MKIIVYSLTYWRLPDEYFEPQQHVLTRVEGSLDRLGSEINKGLPDLVFVYGFALDDLLLSEVARLCRLFPNVAIVPRCDEPDREYLIRLMRAGVREVLLEETSEAVREVLARVSQDLKKANLNNHHRAKTIGLISAKGGDGSSMLAANLATSLSYQPDTRVLALDLALPFGDMDLYLSSKMPLHTLVNFSDEIDRLDASLLGSMAQHLTSQLDLVSSPKFFDEAFRITPQHVQKLIALAVNEYDYVVIDYGSQVSGFVTNTLEFVDDLVMVITATMPSVRHASQLMHLWEGLEYDAAKISLVLNRYSDHYNVTPDDIAKAVGRNPSAILPSEVLAAEDALLNSIPIVRHAPKSKLSKAISDWVVNWTGNHEPEVKSLWHRLKIR